MINCKKLQWQGTHIMKKLIFVFIVLATLSTNEKAFAFYSLDTGSKLLLQCTGGARKGGSIGLHCLGYITGVIDSKLKSEALFSEFLGNDRGARLNGAQFALQPKKFCLPETVTPRQLRSTVIKYLRDNQEKLHMPAVELVIKALEKTFPKPEDSLLCH